ncbi:phage portal protein [Terrihabitans sp. PJ23]|uniref:Phage portal protein n=1 Tax=Terrihabitans rhizophilus TaxID=3092662 RepID=A0ABU4RNL4_9HYPH|nr:phage portal protein [Terrihabitans sp. PJ23]
MAVTPRTAMTCAPVRCAVQAIAEAIGQLPLHVYERDEDGSKERAADHPAQRVLIDPNDWTAGPEFREQLTRDALLHGNGYAFINRVEGRPVELLRLDPESISVTAHPVTGEPVYSRKDGNVQRIIPRSEILHIRAPGFDGLSGTSPVQQARETIGLALVMEQHAARLFGNGARPSGLITFANTLTPEAAARQKAAWQAAHGGRKSGGTAVLDSGASFQALTMTSTDAQFLDLWNRTVLDIARVFRVPPVLIMDYSRQTWTNAEVGGQQFVTYALARWLAAWEGEVRLKLIAPEDRDTFFAEFILDALVKGDIAVRMEAYSKAIAARILCPNEARAAENRPPYEGGDTFENPNTMTAAPAPKQEAV